jgi:hypothetical protein
MEKFTTSASVEAIANATGDNAGIVSENAPKVLLLQRSSPELDRANQKYIHGAEEGDFYIKSHDPPLVRGADGFNLQLYGCFEGWIEREKGRIVGRHAAKPPVGPGGKLLNGNDCEFEKHLYGALDGDPTQICVLEIKKGGFKALKEELMDELAWQSPVVLDSGKSGRASSLIWSISPRRP